MKKPWEKYYAITKEIKVNIKFDQIINYIKHKGFEYVGVDTRDNHFDHYQNKQLKVHLYVPNPDRFGKYETIEFYLKYCIDQLANMLKVNKNELIGKIEFDNYD